MLRHLGSLASVLIAATLVACGQEGAIRHTGGEGGSGATSSSGGSGAGAGSGGSVPAKPLTILDWNVHNFFNDKSADDAPQAPFPPSAAEYAAKRAAIAKVLLEADADVVILAEVENQATLDDLNHDGLGDLYPDGVVIEGNDPRGIDIGALSKIAVDAVVSHKDEDFEQNGTTGPTFSFARDCVELHLSFNGRKVVLLGVHLLAKTTPNSAPKRLAEAQRARAIANAVLSAEPDALVVVLGDFNDTPGSPPVAAVVGSGATAFVDSAMSAPEGDRYTFDFNGSLELIDHRIASPELAKMLDASSVVIRHGGSVDDGPTAPSDHAPIQATYQVH